MRSLSYSILQIHRTYIHTINITVVQYAVRMGGGQSSDLRRFLDEVAVSSGGFALLLNDSALKNSDTGKF